MQKASFSIGVKKVFQGDVKKDYFLNLSTFHGFAFSDRGEDISDLRKNYAFGKPIPRKYFPKLRNQLVGILS